MTAPARVAAYHALRAIAEDRADLPAALADAREHLADDRDRALTAEIVTGALRWQRLLDHLIVHAAGRPLEKIDPAVLCILRLSLHQLLHLDRVPAAAIVDDAVTLTRRARKSSAAGFVNAVLRGLVRQRHRLPLPPPATGGEDRHAQLDYLGITHSHPEWLVARWLERYGFDNTERWVRFNNEIPALTLRANTIRIDRSHLMAALDAGGVETVATRYAPEGLLVSTGNPLRLPNAVGQFLVQDEASQLVSLLVAASPGDRIIDVCAAPGGKTVAMAGDMRDRGMIIACDVRSRRVSLLRDTVRSSGATCARVVHAPAAGPLPFAAGHFDRALVDAPCSGLGTLRRDPDIRWRRNEDQLASLADGQRALLDRTAVLVRPGGRLVYATCSSEPEENQQVVDSFLARHAEFRVEDLRSTLPTHLAPLTTARGFFQTVPFAHGLEAFFGAALVRTDAGA
jgi:16S rRNA (cytosine967-C5)-methyltransferase